MKICLSDTYIAIPHIKGPNRCSYKSMVEARKTKISKARG